MGCSPKLRCFGWGRQLWMGCSLKMKLSSSRSFEIAARQRWVSSATLIAPDLGTVEESTLSPSSASRRIGRARLGARAKVHQTYAERPCISSAASTRRPRRRATRTAPTSSQAPTGRTQSQLGRGTIRLVKALRISKALRTSRCLIHAATPWRMAYATALAVCRRPIARRRKRIS